MKRKIKATTWSNGVENYVEEEPRLQLDVQAFPPSKSLFFLYSLYTLFLFLALSVIKPILLRVSLQLKGCGCLDLEVPLSVPLFLLQDLQILWNNTYKKLILRKM